MASQFGRPATQLTAGRGRGPGSKNTALAQRARRCPIPHCGELIDPSSQMCRTHCAWCPSSYGTGYGYLAVGQRSPQSGAPGRRPCGNHGLPHRRLVATPAIDRYVNA